MLSKVREFRRGLQRIKIGSVYGVAFMVLILSAVVGGTVAAVDGKYIQATVLFAILVAAVSLFRVTNTDESYDRYREATEVLKEMSELIVDMEKEDLPIDSVHGEKFYKHFNAAQDRINRKGRLTRNDMDFVSINTALAYTALEDHAAVESVEEV